MSDSDASAETLSSVMRSAVSVRDPIRLTARTVSPTATRTRTTTDAPNLTAMPRSLNQRTRGAVVDMVVLLGRRSEEHTSELQSRQYLVCRLLLEKKKKEPL